VLLGNIYVEAGRDEEAMAAYKQAMNLDLDNPQAHYHLVEVYLRMGDRDSALEQYETLRTLDEELANELSGLIH
jgi:tetratricopeptide (TPR) repeat protein